MLHYFLILTLFGLVIGLNDYSKKHNKIAAGEETTIEEHPYQVSIQIIEDNENSRHYCGGSLIRLDVVLTAAHCMMLPINTYSVRAGSKFKSCCGQVLTLLSVAIHPKYDVDNDDYDISIIKLPQQFVRNPSVATIQVQPVIIPIPTGTEATITGWGYTTELEDTPEILRKVKVQKIDRRACRKFFYNHVFTHRMVCYGFAGRRKDACQADSGGPLVIGEYQVGIASWGIGCIGPNYPGVYTDLRSKELQNFIFKHVY